MASSLLSPAQRTLFNKARGLFFGNPFHEETQDTLESLLGPEYNPIRPEARFGDWNDNRDRAALKVARALRELAKSEHGTPLAFSEGDARLAQGAVLFTQYVQSREVFHDEIEKKSLGRRRRPALNTNIWGTTIEDDIESLGTQLTPPYPKAHLTAVYYQMHRAESRILQTCVGAASSTAQLRAHLWRSLFTHNLECYLRAAHTLTPTIPTRILGATGTRKDRIARLLASCQYIPFDSGSRRFEVHPDDLFSTVDLTTTEPQRFDEAFFGRSRNSPSESKSPLDRVHPYGAIFINNIDAASTPTQAKILNFINSRRYRFVNQSDEQLFSGKLILGTRDKTGIETTPAPTGLLSELDLATRADILELPPLQQTLLECPDDFWLIAQSLAAELTGDPNLTAELTQLALAWRQQTLYAHYHWPENLRELELCLRSLLLKGYYQPPTLIAPSANAPVEGMLPTFITQMMAGELKYEDLLQNYFKIVVEKEGGFAQAARAVGVDQRTVKKYYSSQVSR